jgi:signal transduction histidine kinase
MGTGAFSRHDGLPDPLSWQQSTLHTKLRMNAAALCLTPLVASAVAGTFPGYYWFIELAGLLSLLLTRVAQRAYRAVAVTTLLVILFTILVVGYHNAWIPSVVGVLCYLSVAAGLLFGRWALVLVAVVTSAILELGGWLVLTGRFSVPMHALLDPDSTRNWIRISLVFLLIIGMSTWVLRLALEAANRVEHAASSAFRAARERLAAATRLRAERMAQEVSVRHSQRLQMVAQLGEGFAHLFNNMLTVVRCGCDELRASRGTLEVRQIARDMRKVASECADRTREMLVMSRTNEESFSDVALDTALAAGFAKLTGRLRTNIRCELAAEPCGIVHMPSPWLEHMLTNLLLNAEQALPEGGHVRVQTALVNVEQARWSTIDRLDPGHYAVLSVSDDGLGMSEEVAERACEPFFTTLSPARHAGLGLTLVHGMAKQLGGSLQLRRLEKGTRVSVFLPTRDSGSQHTSLTPAQDGPASRPAPAAEPRLPSSATPARVSEPARDSPPPAEVVTMEAEGQLVAAPALPSSLPSAAAPLDGTPSPAPMLPEEELAAEPSRSARSATGLAQIIRVVAGILFIESLITFRMGFRHIASAYLIASAVLLGLTLVSRVPDGVRLWSLLVTTLGLILTSIANSSYLTPSPMAGLACLAFLAAVYGTRRTTVGILIGVALCLACAAWLWTHTQLHASIDRVVPDRAANWFRVGVALPLVITGIAVAVLRVVSAARTHAAALVRAHAQLEQSHAVYQAETESLLTIEETRSRAARMEVGGLLTGMMAHDLNNCLGAIVGWADILEESGESDEIDEAVTTISRSADYAEALVQQLQHRIGVDHRDQSLDIAHALDRMKPMLLAATRMPRHKVALDIEAERGCFVAVSEHSLRRIVLNLVTNARDACGEQGGRCDIRTTLESSTVTLQVVDNGCGIDASTRRGLFQAFFTTKGAHGTGLGLHSVREIVEATGGTIDVWSEPGVGTRMTIAWPRAPAPLSTAPRADAAHAPTGKARILLAEDHAIVRQVMARGLRQAGYDVHEAQDGDDALSRVTSKQPFDVLCTDAIMPGQPVARLIQCFSETYPGQPIFIVSGYMPEELLPQLRAHPEVHMLFKPLTPARLVEAIQSKVA